MNKNALDVAFAARLIPVAVIDNADDALPLAEALRAGGLNVIELTLRTPAALEAIRRITKELPDMFVGAGTVIDANIVPEVIQAGARFCVAPGLNDSVLDACSKAGIPLIPGVVTPTEVERAMAKGLTLLKFFPAEAAGGAKYLTALAGPYGHTGLRFIPTGGITPQTLSGYLDIKMVAAVGGSWFVDKKLVNAGDFRGIERLTREAIALANIG